MAYAFDDPKHIPLGATRDVPIVPKQTAVLVVDVQRYCSVPNVGANKDKSFDSMPYFFGRVDRMVDNIGALLDAARQNSAEVIYTFIQALTHDGRDASLDYKLSGPLHVSKGDSLADIMAPIAPKGDDILIPKTSCSVFNSTNIHYVLSNLGVRQLVICGQLTNQCVESAVRDAADLGYLVTVIEDGCAARSKDEHERGLANMRGFARIISTAQAVREFSSTPPTTEGSDVTLPQINGVNGALSSIAPVKPPREAVPAIAGQTCDAATEAMKTALLHAGITCLCISFVDLSGQVRSKALTLARHDAKGILAGVGIPECILALPSFCDAPAPGCGLWANKTLSLKPDLSTLEVIPYRERHAHVFGQLYETDGTLSPICPRGLLRRIVTDAITKHNMHITVGCEVEFCLLTADRRPINRSHWALDKAFHDAHAVLDDIHDACTKHGVPVLQIHGEAAPGQFEVVLEHSDAMKLVDNIIRCHQIIQAVAKKHGLTSTQIPSMDPNQPGTGEHFHLSFTDSQGVNLFPDASRPYGFSRLAEQFMAGVFEHLPALTAITVPSPNSFRRLVPDHLCGAHHVWGVENKEAPIRVCTASSSGIPLHFELKAVDAMCNPYLALAAIIASGLDGIDKGAHLPPPVQTLERLEESERLPASLEAAIEQLEKDTMLLETMGPRLAQVYIAVKRSEINHFKNLTLAEEVDTLLTKAF